MNTKECQSRKIQTLNRDIITRMMNIWSIKSKEYLPISTISKSVNRPTILDIRFTDLMMHYLLCIEPSENLQTEQINYCRDWREGLLSFCNTYKLYISNLLSVCGQFWQLYTLGNTEFCNSLWDCMLLNSNFPRTQIDVQNMIFIMKHQEC